MGEQRSPKAAQIALLMTRPAAGARRFVAQLPEDLRAQLLVIEAPLMQITPLQVEVDAGQFSGVIFSSANGVAAAGLGRADKPAYCVGRRTTEAAASAGWQAQFSGATAAELLQVLKAQRPPAPLLHLHGRHTRGNVAARLSAAGLPCSSQTLYEQELLPLPDGARQQIRAQNSVIVPLFSPRLARHFASLGLDQTNLSLIALSDAVAVELKDLNCKDLRVSKTPDAIGMVDMVRDAAVRLAHLEGDNPAQ